MQLLSTERLDLPDDVELVWHGLNDRTQLARFLRSDVDWGEVDVRPDPTGRPVLRHDGFDTTPPDGDERLVGLDECLHRFAVLGRRVKIDLKCGDADFVHLVSEAVRREGIGDASVWFNATVDTLGASGFEQLRWAHPASVVQCPVDFLAPIVVCSPPDVRALVERFVSWGVDRFSVSWANTRRDELVDALIADGHAVNLYGVVDHEQLTAAADRRPASVTADLAIPRLGFHGTGSGERHRIDPVDQVALIAVP